MDRLLVCGLHGSPLSDNPVGVTMSHALGYMDFPEPFGKIVAVSQFPSRVRVTHPADLLDRYLLDICNLSEALIDRSDQCQSVALELLILCIDHHTVKERIQLSLESEECF